MSNEIIKIQNICKEYGEDESKTIALNHVSFDIYEGEFLVILGSSGSGKSTLLNALGGMDKVDKGTITYNNRNICQMNANKLADYRYKTIGFIFQAFNLIQELTAYENVFLVCNNEKTAKEALKSVGLENKMDKYPSKLSGGEQQRVSIARALAKDPQILLCDEPTGALDYETGRSILKLLEEVCRKQHKTVVFVTHTREIAKMANRIINMRNGQIVSIEENISPISAENVEW